ncbi:MAG: flagellar motor switch protein FliG [Desulfuromonadaceae bacterium]|nr:flagellar motor switch protein FliG [Desulfuromonadaceae bacterium]
MDSQKLTGAKKAAVLLLCLGEEATLKVFESLSDPEVREITRHMVNIEHIPAEVSRDVVAEFHRTQKAHAGIFVRGNEFVKNVISGGDQSRVERLMEDITWDDEARPLETIAIMQPHMVASLLDNEHPQTVALILSTQKIEHSAKVLNFMNDSLRSDVMYRIARIEQVSPEIVGQIEDALRKEIGIVARQDKQQQLGGINRVVDIINNMGQGADKSILQGIEKTDPDMAEEIRKNMFRFEDLVNLDGRTLQTVLREVNNDQLTLALKSASEGLKESIFQNISGRAAEMIQDDLEAMGPVKLSEVETMQQTIVKIILKLEEEEKILIPGRGGADALV